MTRLKRCSLIPGVNRYLIAVGCNLLAEANVRLYWRRGDQATLSPVVMLHPDRLAHPKPCYLLRERVGTSGSLHSHEECLDFLEISGCCFAMCKSTSIHFWSRIASQYRFQSCSILYLSSCTWRHGKATSLWATARASLWQRFCRCSHQVVAGDASHGRMSCCGG